MRKNLDGTTYDPKASHDPSVTFNGYVWEASCPCGWKGWLSSLYAICRNCAVRAAYDHLVRMELHGSAYSFAVRYQLVKEKGYNVE